MSIRKNTTRPKVIVRSFGGEPVALFVHRLDTAKGRAFVGSASATKPISLPFEDVFDYDQRSFTELRDAFTRSDQERLRELYNSLQRKSPCSKYQDALIYAHEEKGQVANTRSAA